MKFPADVPLLTDGVVTLRAHTEDDIQPLLEQALDPETVAWTTVPVPSSEETSRAYATRVIPSGWEAGSSWAFAVEAADEAGVPRYCGTVELRDAGDRRAEIAYGAHPWARGRSVLERACRLLLEWGFRERRLESVIWWAHQGNWASRKLAWRLGFAVDGAVRRWLPQRGELRDAWVGVLLASDPREPRSEWYDVPRITSDTVVLRDLRVEDAGRIQQACSDERLQYWLSEVPSPYTLEDAHAFIESCVERRATGSALSWAVADVHSDDLVGTIGLFDLKPGHQAEIGYWTHPEARGRGVMSEACALVTRHAFLPAEDGGMGLLRLSVFAAEPNAASRRVIEACGFVQTSRDRDASRRRDGTLHDHIGYDLLVEEWSAANRRR